MRLGSSALAALLDDESHDLESPDSFEDDRAVANCGEDLPRLRSNTLESLRL